MASFRSIISIIKAAARNDANATLNALGDFGPMTYLAGLSSDGSWPPTHYVSSHTSTTVEQHAMWAGLIDGVLPEIAGTWGEDGAPTELAALAAFGNGNVLLDCITHTDPEFDVGGHFTAIAAAQGLQPSNPPE